MEKKQLLNKEKVDLYLKIGILLVLIIGVFVFGRGGFKCQLNPFIYGAQEMVEKETDKGHMECSCIIYEEYAKDYSQKKYAFDEKYENPPYLTNPEEATTILIDPNLIIKEGIE